MASIEFIQKRIAGKQKEIEKLTKKLERIRKAEASGWEENPYYYGEHDLRYTIRDLEAAKEALAKYEADLTSANEKAQSRNVKAILEFLDLWKKRCTEFYGNGLKEYYEEDKLVRQLFRERDKFLYGTPERDAIEEKFTKASAAFYSKRTGYFEDWEDVRNGRKYRGRRKIRDGEYEYLAPYSYERTLPDAMARLKKDLDEEANRKYDFIIERTNAIVGKITDATGLKVGAKQDLNGYIIGERGRAKVNTIGAGGYNIQCFHFRTLIHEA